MDVKKIKSITDRLARKYSTRNPFELAEYLNIRVFFAPLGNIDGFYKYMKRHRCIFINSSIEDKDFQKFVMAHELGHALLHPRENFCYIENFTNLKASRAELEANQFAAQLLIPDEAIYEAFDNHDITISQLSRILGYSEKIIMLRFRNCGLI